MNMRHTMNWKLILGVGIIALAVVAIALRFAWGLSPLLLLALCPLMMFLMMRGMGPMRPDEHAAPLLETNQRSMPDGTPEEQRAQHPALIDTPARQSVPIEVEGQSPQEPVARIQLASAMPRGDTSETRERRADRAH